MRHLLGIHQNRKVAIVMGNAERTSQMFSVVLRHLLTLRDLAIDVLELQEPIAGTTHIRTFIILFF